MSQLNAFYKIGTIGMILTAALHISLAAILGSSLVHTSFAVIYPSWIAFLGLGTAQMRRKKDDQA